MPDDGIDVDNRRKAVPAAAVGGPVAVAVAAAAAAVAGAAEGAAAEFLVSALARVARTAQETGSAAAGQKCRQLKPKQRLCRRNSVADDDVAHVTPHVAALETARGKLERTDAGIAHQTRLKRAVPTVRAATAVSSERLHLDPKPVVVGSCSVGSSSDSPGPSQTAGCSEGRPRKGLLTK